MKQVLPLALAILIAGCAAPRTKTPALKPGHRMTVRTTAYTHTEPGGRNNAIGTRLRFGGHEQSAASDWSWLPLGTKFRVLETGKTYVIEDYGSALVGRKTVDLYQSNMRAVRRWGVRNVDIEITEWGSRAMSLKLLAPRARKGYIRTMVAALRKTLPGAPSS
ncbi:MAG TPA: 3D domain-containing protein [Chthoniobacteraceae bacterium]|jgi:3D (Asp-Asp-Asp) domain-containing protein|nr:3D domain-containing protein [Chthoniobacteraceae bacterium]